MVQRISDELAERFANALIAHGGNQTAAARACGYDDGPGAGWRGRDLARNPKVLKCLQPLLVQHLQSLTTRAVQTLGALLSNKSGYIRLEAAKDILNRNGVGADAEPLRAQPLVVRINLAVQAPASTATVIDQYAPVVSGLSESTGGRKTRSAEDT